MPYFVRIGHIPTNLGKVGSRGYCLVRKGRTILASWGAIEVLPGRRFHWCHLPQSKRYRFASEKRAQEEMQARIRKRIEKEGYDRLPGAVRIRLARRQ